MTPNLLDELEKIVALSERATQGEWHRAQLSNVIISERKSASGITQVCAYRPEDDALCTACVNFLRTHAPALADMAKRMEAAERDAAILRNARIHLPTKVGTQKLGDYSPEEMAAFDSGYNMALDRAHNLLNRYPGAIAAIDATQEDAG